MRPGDARPLGDERRGKIRGSVDAPPFCGRTGLGPALTARTKGGSGRGHAVTNRYLRTRRRCGVLERALRARRTRPAAGDDAPLPACRRWPHTRTLPIRIQSARLAVRADTVGQAGWIHRVAPRQRGRRGRRRAHDAEAPAAPQPEEARCAAATRCPVEATARVRVARAEPAVYPAGSRTVARRLQDAGEGSHGRPRHAALDRGARPAVLRARPTVFGVPTEPVSTSTAARRRSPGAATKTRLAVGDQRVQASSPCLPAEPAGGGLIVAGLTAAGRG